MRNASCRNFICQLSLAPQRHRAVDTDGHRRARRGIKRPGRERALRKMLRAQAILAVAQNQTIKELEIEMRGEEHKPRGGIEDE